MLLRLAAIAALSASVGLVASASRAQENLPPTVTVSGEGLITVAPDLAELRLGANVHGKTVREATDANTRTMAAVLAAAREMGIAGKDIQTARFSVQPVYAETQQGRPPRVDGYQVVNQVVAKVRDVTKVAAVLDRLVAAGANDVVGVEFGLTDPSKAADAARTLAIGDAKRKADIYARAAGAQVGRVFAIVEDGALPPQPLGPLRTRTAAAESTPIASGEETLRVTLTVSYELVR